MKERLNLMEKSLALKKELIALKDESIVLFNKKFLLQKTIQIVLEQRVALPHKLFACLKEENKTNCDIDEEIVYWIETKPAEILRMFLQS